VNLIQATRSYERWLGEKIRLVRRDLVVKHTAMRESPFTLLRASFYRWMQLWSEHAKELARAPVVLAVGDLHVENFGTWRDAEGRLIWGVNDFDEAYPLPFVLDLVRLATSAHLAVDERHLALRERDACDAILDGYIEGLEEGGRAFVLSERNTWLWRLAVSELRNPKRFWHLQERKCTPPPVDPPRDLVRFVRTLLPKGSGPLRTFHRTAGKGSLGRQRFLFRVDWTGGITTREAKALAPSACAWAAGDDSPRVHYEQLIDGAVRARDPFVSVFGPWIIRRLAPDCSKIDLAILPTGLDEARLLWAMGFETANVHLATRTARRPILRYLDAAPARWLDRATRAMVAAVRNDWREWTRATKA
jgi:hypothetical protein